MPSVPMPVSTLSDVLRRVQLLFSELGDGTPILIGKQHVSEPGPGSPPRIVFVPDERGRLLSAQQLNSGYLAAWSHGCTVHVRGVDGGEEAGRLDAAVALADRVIQCLKALDPAHLAIEGEGPSEDSPLAVDAYGGGIVFSFRFTRHTPSDPAVIRAARALTAISPPDPDRPQGDTGNSFSVTTPAGVVRP